MNNETTTAVDDKGLDKLPAPVTIKLDELGQDVWISNADAEADRAASDPEEILLFAWMNAKISHVTKYASKYRKMFPATTLLIVETHSSFFFSSYATQKNILEPIIERLRAQPTKRRLVHAFSNGGACQLAALAAFMAEEQPSKPALSFTSLILDSCPGGTDLAPALKAFTMGMPPVAKYPIWILLTCLWVSLFTYDKLIASEPGHVLKMRRDLNNLDYIEKDCPRLYIYSDTDELVSAHWVDEHVADAKQKGVDVSVEKYGTSAHVSHARTDGKRYWSAVQQHWQNCTSTRR